MVKTAVDDAGKKTRKVQKMKKTGETRDDFERRRKQEKTETAQHQVLTDILNAIWQPEFRNQLQQAGRARSVRDIQERIDVQHISNQVESLIGKVTAWSTWFWKQLTRLSEKKFLAATNTCISHTCTPTALFRATTSSQKS